MRAATRAAMLAGGAAVVALMVYAYRELPGRSFAADDFQWLLNVEGLAPAELLTRALDPFAQQHFYRPLVWALIWAQTYLYGLDPGRFHWVSLYLHGLNALLAGWLAARLVGGSGEPRGGGASRAAAFLVAALVVALHPAPFEAVVWVSAQSELLGAALLLGALHLWLGVDAGGAGALGRWGAAALATGALGLAMLTKESAALGLPLMLLLGLAAGRRQGWTLILPGLLTAAFVALQIEVARQNTALAEGRYGLGWQLVTNPLRSLALVAAPLPGTEHADSAWLVPAGAAALAVLLVGCAAAAWRARGAGGPQMRVVRVAALAASLLLSLLPTAPFLSPPDSRYLYLPVAFAGMLLGLLLAPLAGGAPGRGAWVLRGAALVGLAAAIWWAGGEASFREWRFSAGSGPGGSLWRLTQGLCAGERPRRLIIVEPPIAGPHVEAIVALSCGDATRAVIVGRDGVDGAIRERSAVIAFPGGSAAVERVVESP